MTNRMISPTGSASYEVRVLLENGEYWLNNKGDLAILDETVRRFAERWPHARIGVLTSAPALLRAYEPRVDAICYQRGGRWPRRRRRPGPVGLLGPGIAGAPMNARDAAVAMPGRIVRRVRRVVGTTHDAQPVPDAVTTASLVVAIGGGYMTDIDRFQTERTLKLLEQAADLGIPTAMTGQGFGPLTEPDLLERAAQVLPRVNLIGLREGLRGPELLRSLGVPTDRIVITGDDAVDLGFSTRRTELGTDLGVCLRVAEYSPVGATIRDVVGRVVREHASAHGARLVPLIVSEHDGEDRRSTMPLLAEYPETVPALGRFADARTLSREVGRCRIIVTGAYHVAVFALSQGISVVGLSTSRYYDDKFAGLNAMFGAGIETVRLDEAGIPDRLRSVIERTWSEAPQVRSVLLARAENQIRASRTVFDRIAGFVEETVSERHDLRSAPSVPPTSPR
ncbi:polysaccharide pyruvyl transferase family protein [Rhodococcus pyridinivorans]|uniref:polysaccharide pyruvyl transferase family protein n=1 Tax=Rhodococcus pyridinivorans TaxID=103816 RepID=UPI00207905E4|nr:polysaccharide pyruvyl transferase family protein [Rhodococcus pyridinivorans]USI91346.1 polysaccharide pyruvyl transferase family protein [Rhodococcus pyridinivorans]